MPQLRVMYWNIQTFGWLGNTYRTLPAAQCQLIAQVAFLNNADIIIIQEFMEAAVNTHLNPLLRRLNGLPAPFNNWYCDWIKGSIKRNTEVPPPVYPYATQNDLDWDDGHGEGYAVFWNQNIAKFTVMSAPPILAPGSAPPAVPNTQSDTVRMRGTVLIGAVRLVVNGMPVPATGIPVPATYVIPAGTTPLHGAPSAADVVVVPGTAAAQLTQGTLIGPAGVTLNGQVNGVNPVVVPGGFTLTEDLTLPAVGEVVVPAHVLSLVFFGREITHPGARAVANNVAGDTANFNPGAVNNWDWLNFPQGVGTIALQRGPRRPTYLTLNVNRNPPVNPANSLMPILAYHSPSANVPSKSGMQRASYSQPFYQAFNPAGGGAWIDCQFALLGGDFNVDINAAEWAYLSLMLGFAAGGANSTPAINNPAPPGGTQKDNPLNKSLVNIGDFGPPIISPNFDNYLDRAIDNVFYRGFAPANVAGQINNLLVAASGGNAAYPALPAPTIQEFRNIPLIAACIHALGAHMPFPAIQNIEDIIVTIWDINAGSFNQSGTVGNSTPARRSAEFVKLFVSDHLPVVFQMTL